MIDRDRQLADQRQAGVLQQIVDVVDGAGAGVFNRHHGVIRLAGLDLVKNVGKLRAAAFNKFFEMASGILTCGQVRIGALWPEESDTRRVRIGFIEVLLE